MSVSTVRIPVAAIALDKTMRPTARWVQDEATLAVANLLLQASGTLLDEFIALLTRQLHALPHESPKAHKSTIMRLIAHLDERREETELAANPERRAGIERVGEHFARKAQSGWSRHPLPEPPTAPK